jgi:hypothetical protein
MRFLAIAGVGLIGGATALAAQAAPARAGGNDLVMSRLGDIKLDGLGQPIDVIGRNLDYRSLASELGVVMAPRLLTPSDTLGFGGFQFAVDMQATSITNDADYWRALESSQNPGGTGVDHGESIMPTVGFFVRKGIWLPMPSFEVGLGAVHLLDSEMWAAQGYVKFAMHEGFHDFPLPSVAVRGGGSRVMGTDQIDLSVGSLDISVSKDLGYQGTITVSPYGGWNVLWIVPRSEVIDKTPGIDTRADPSDINMNFAFKDQQTITRHRFFGGFKLQYYVFQLTFEAMIALPGSSVDDRSGTDMDCADIDPTRPTTSCDSTDQSGTQETYTVSVGLDF